MPRFHVKGTFEIPGLNLFFMAGYVVEGEIRRGMSVRIPSNSAVDMVARITSIESARRQGGGEDVCLGLESEEDAPEFWRGFNISDETLEITEDAPD